ncbi:hypothetical protein EDC01DRAFT_776393 [Geopyxis carbonaria]|nr:hypothetical protein EDC01DRAFT_776393 [Geopyxis carbonaria]
MSSLGLISTFFGFAAAATVAPTTAAATPTPTPDPTTAIDVVTAEATARACAPVVNPANDTIDVAPASACLAPAPKAATRSSKRVAARLAGRGVTCTAVEPSIVPTELASVRAVTSRVTVKKPATRNTRGTKKTAARNRKAVSRNATADNPDPAAANKVARPKRVRARRHPQACRRRRPTPTPAATTTTEVVAAAGPVKKTTTSTSSATSAAITAINTDILLASANVDNPVTAAVKKRVRALATPHAASGRTRRITNAPERYGEWNIPSPPCQQPQVRKSRPRRCVPRLQAHRRPCDRPAVLLSAPPPRISLYSSPSHAPPLVSPGRARGPRLQASIAKESTTRNPAVRRAQVHRCQEPRRSEETGACPCGTRGCVGTRQEGHEGAREAVTKKKSAVRKPDAAAGAEKVEKRKQVLALAVSSWTRHGATGKVTRVTKATKKKPAAARARKTAARKTAARKTAARKTAARKTAAAANIKKQDVPSPSSRVSAHLAARLGAARGAVTPPTAAACRRATAKITKVVKKKFVARKMACFDKPSAAAADNKKKKRARCVWAGKAGDQGG